ncbi:MAG: periplasmic heavy metal sensor [bacterium]
MKLQGRILICLLVIMSLGATPAYAASSRGRQDEPNPETREAQIVEIFQQLNLTPEQDSQLKAHRNRHEKQQEELKGRIRAKKEELKQELQKPDLQMEKINQLHAELKALLGQKEDNRLEGILEVRKILTPQQLVKFLDLIGKHHPGPEGKGKDRE